jgi:hypothetical protein
MKDFDEDEEKKKAKTKHHKKHSSGELQALSVWMGRLTKMSFYIPDFKLIAIAIFFWIFSPRK